MSSSVIGHEPVGRRSAESESARAGSGEARRSLSMADHLTLLAIGLVVLLVSLPRLRRFALRENETDAIHMVRLLSADAAQSPEVLGAGGLGALLAASARQRTRFEDVELLPDGKLRRHGYVFDIGRCPKTGEWVVLAWPWEHGHTGLGAFVGKGALVFGCENEDGRFSGTRPPPAASVDAGAARWLLMRGG